MLFYQKHMKHIKNITWSQLNHPSLSEWSTVCTRQDLGREFHILQYVTLTLDVYRVCRCVGRCFKNASCSSSSRVKVNGEYCWDVLLSQLILDAINTINTSLITILITKMGDGGGEHWLVRMEWRPAGWSVCLPLLIFPCTIKSRSSVLAPAHPGGPEKRAVERLWWWWSQFCLSARQFTGASFVQNSTSFLLSYSSKTVQSLTPLTTIFRESSVK